MTWSLALAVALGGAIGAPTRYLIDSRISRVALRADVPIVGAEEVVQEAGIEIPDEEEPVEEDQVEQFRAFLDEVSPEDFGAPGPS